MMKLRELCMFENCFSMALLRTTTNLVLASLLLYGSAETTAQKLPAPRTPVNLAVQVIYDQEFHHHIIDTQTFQRESRKGADDYLAALLKGVELRFLDLPDYEIKLTLINVYKRMDLAVPASPSYHNALDGEETLKKLQSELQTNSRLYSKGSIVVFVTGKEVIAPAGKKEQWRGVAQRGQVCKNKVALVSDNGKTFTGTDSLALQVALLLNASRDGIDNMCEDTEYLLLSSIHGGFYPNLSNCSKEDMVNFLKSTEENCWNDEVKDLYNGVLPAIYHKITGYDICTVYYRDNRNVMTCKGEDLEPKNTTCRVRCCDYYYLKKHFFYTQTAADGTWCGEGKICVKKECVNMGTSNYSP